MHSFNSVIFNSIEQSSLLIFNLMVLPDIVRSKVVFQVSEPLSLIYCESGCSIPEGIAFPLTPTRTLALLPAGVTSLV